MKRMAVMIASLCLITTSWAQSDHTEKGTTPMQTVNDSRMVAPALEKYAQGPLAELWKRPGLTPRDHSMVTIAALIARNQTIEMPYYFNLALDNDAEAKRAAAVEQQFGNVAPGIVQYTTDVLFRDLWLRPDLAPRDRSLVTVSALIANGQTAQLTPHLNRAMDNGLTLAQAAEAITHLAFYVGWPNVFSAMPVAKDVFAKRPR